MKWIPAGLIAVLLACPVPAVSSDPPPESKPTESKQPAVEDLVADLGSGDFNTREKAQRELWQRGVEQARGQGNMHAAEEMQGMLGGLE